MADANVQTTTGQSFCICEVWQTQTSKLPQRLTESPGRRGPKNVLAEALRPFGQQFNKRNWRTTLAFQRIEILQEKEDFQQLGIG